MAQDKIKDTEFKTIVVEHSNPETEAVSGYVGGNNLIINGKRAIKHYRFQIGKEIELPVTFIQDLKNRSMVLKGTGGKPRNVKLYSIAEV